jgi:hypothetical protein
MQVRAGDSARLMRGILVRVLITIKVSALIQRDCLAFKAHICATL